MSDSPQAGTAGAAAAAERPQAAPTDAPTYTPREMMAIAAGRFIKDGDVLLFKHAV